MSTLHTHKMLRMNYKKTRITLVYIISLLIALMISEKSFAQNELTDIYDPLKDFASNKTAIYDELKKQDLNVEQLMEQIKKLNTVSQPHYQLQLCKILIQSRKYDSVPQLLDNCIHRFEQSKNTEAIGDCYFYKGKIGGFSSNAEEVITNYEKSYLCYIDVGNMSNAFLCQMSMGNYFSQNGNDIYAAKYYNKANKIVESHDIKTSYKESLMLNMGNHYFKTNDYDSALLFYNKVEASRQIEGNIDKLSRIKNNIGVAYLQLGDLDMAEKKLLEALKIREAGNDSLLIASTLVNLFKLTLDKKDVDKAIGIEKRLSNIIENTENIQTDKLVAFSYDKLKLYHLTKQSELADKELIKYSHLNDSLTQAAFADKLVELHKSFEIQEKDKDIALLQKEEALNKATLKLQWLMISFITALVFALLILGYFINRQRLHLKKSEENLQKQQLEIEQINNELKISNQAKDRILSIIGHDLRGPIGGLKELIELYLELPDFDEKDIRNLLKAAREASTGSYLLLENLLTWANSQRGQIEFKPSDIPFLPLVKQSVQLLNAKHVTFRYEIPPALMINADANMLRTIIRNLVSNAIKYSPANGRITISANQDEVETSIFVADEGIGMSAEQTSALFEKKETFFIEAGSKAKGTGLGLILCKEFVERHNGRIWVDSMHSEGTKVGFTIPNDFTATKSVPELSKHSKVLS
nr:tetratricopeptide repeat-containing sensor histidine kinase [uncultured Carboxylicivirga sp.]